MRNRMIALLAGLMVLGIAGTALAAPSVDTVLVQGYDADEMRLIFGVSEIWEEGDDSGTELDCSVEMGTYAYTIPADPETSGMVIETLKSGTDDVTFEYEDGTAGAQVAYGSLTAVECLLSYVDVTGPNGQVNHGQIQSSLVHALKAMGLKGMGCLTSQFSKLGYGKADQQVKVGDDVTPSTAPLEVELKSLEGACDKGKKKAEGELSPGQLKKQIRDGAPGKPDWAKGPKG